MRCLPWRHFWSYRNNFESLSKKLKKWAQARNIQLQKRLMQWSIWRWPDGKTADMLSGIDGIMNLAAASGSDLARTSDIVTDALTAFGKQAKDSGEFADVLAAASANANTNVDLMGETFKYVGSVAGAMGYSIQDISLATGLWRIVPSKEAPPVRPSALLLRVWQSQRKNPAWQCLYWVLVLLIPMEI